MVLEAHKVMSVSKRLHIFRKQILIVRAVSSIRARLRVQSRNNFSTKAAKENRSKKNYLSGINAFSQLWPMLGYSYFRPKLIQYFSIYDVGFYCFIVFTQYSFIKKRLPKTIVPFRKRHNHRETIKFAIFQDGIKQWVYINTTQY